MVKLLYISSKLHVITMSVIVSLQTRFCDQHSDVFIIYFCSKLQTLGTTGFLVTAIKLKAEGNLYMRSALFWDSTRRCVVTITTRRHVISQKSADLINIVAEA
jgi:hypothetical protein